MRRKIVLKKNYLSLLVVLFSFCPVFAQTVETVIEFSEDNLIFSRVDGYDLVEVDSLRSFLDGVEGEPFLPVVTANVLLPAGAEVVDVYTEVEEETEIAGYFLIMPAQKPVPVSSDNRPGFVRPKPEVYNSSIRQRRRAVEGVSRKIMRGHYLAGVKVHPVDYIPVEGRLILRNKIRIYVEYNLGKKKILRYRADKDNVFKKIVNDSVLNPQSMNTYYEQTDAQMSQSSEGVAVTTMGVPTDVVEYLIITETSFVDEFQALADWKTKKGVPAQVISLDTIYANYTGPTNQYKIKSCIRDYALNKGTIWVALGDDFDAIRDLDCYSGG
jgi:hypothetical protein